jgi:hypothetical protein
MIDNVPENSDQRNVERFVKTEKILPGSDGWLSPNGNFYVAKSDEHDEAAKWIIENNLSELRKRIGRNHLIRSDSDLREKSELSPRQFLNINRWILINGPVFHTENALNYTTKQLELLSEASIPIIGAFDGSKEFSSKETFEWVNKTVERISDFIQNPEILVWNYEKGYERKVVSQDEYWKHLDSLGSTTLEDFKKDPFHSVFSEFGCIGFTDVRDVITEGFKDEIIFDRGMETYTLRLIQLPSGERICVEYTFHHHDRDFGNENHMHIYVVDDFSFRDKINNYLSAGSHLVTKYEPQIKGEYFRKIVENT